jgi:putative flavoprotein involved in K+ transport
MTPTVQSLDVLVIGAGQAGLAIGRQLGQTDLGYLLVDGHERIGDSWRKRFDSLVLFTPRAYSALPGLPLPGDPGGYPTKDELADYLERYAIHFDLPIRMGTGVNLLERRDGLFHATTTSGDMFAARAVVIATGAFQQPVIPPVARLLDPHLTQLAADTYRNPDDIPAGTVLVVGDGATGRQIALELSGKREVLLATGRPRRVSRDRILGKSIFWWMDKLGVIHMSPQSRVGRKLRAADPFPGKHLEFDRLREHGVTVVGRLDRADGRTVAFGTDERVDIDAVIWATGYRDRTEWVRIPEAVDGQGRFVEEGGISPVPGLFHIGRSWQTSRGSALITGVGADATYVTEQLRRAGSETRVTSSSGEAQPTVAAGTP